ncbi:hypothetical protein M409DRAFT_17639 [Zasmidium cellare ATCC 36951]|uniref:N-acetyltransferase domain-containing protein n=1 Tax=Zasmidium cellare ATCC 36951 TaxID=1080233 RepID=A0A6A6D426_ZASCE|nr:uncharacterized protein M409DRAFT_17639 [Zasmidium cellare ATCC 36951]KAF2172406.1 hypothetical protein M409DRAFT_17639 [Zasmidium cellare ATCC 36951]
MADLWSSARLIYRGVDDEDEEFLGRLSSDPIAFLNIAPHVPSPRGKKTAARLREQLQSPDFLVAAIICLPPTGEDAASTVDKAIEISKDKDKPKPTPIGQITLRGEDIRNQHHRRCEIGINVLREYQGKGYGTEAIKWVLRWGFKRANMHRIGIGAFAWNQDALRLYEKLGFVHEARKRDFFWHDGRYQDLVEMGMLEDEWREIYDQK